jgi:PAS domain S-box-containing protein
MKHNQTYRLWRSAALCVFGSIGLALVTFVGYRLQLNLATTALLYMIVVVLMSLTGSFVSSAFISIIAVLGLAYFFAPPIFSLRVADPLNVVALMSFLTTAVVITRLMSKVRKSFQEIQASKDQLRLIIDTVPAMTWSALPDGSRDFLNQRWLEYTGLSLEEGLGWGWTAAIHPEDLSRFEENWHAAVTTGQPLEAEARARRADGEYRWLLIRAVPLRDALGNIVKWYGTSTDIEDCERAQNALRHSEEQWRDVFENNPAMYFMVDAAGTILSVNPFGAEQLGYTVNELVGHAVLNVFYEADRDAVQSNVAICLEQLGRAMSWEFRKVRKDGTVLWVRETAKAVRRAKNHPIVLIACEDITDRKQAQDKLQRSDAYLAEAQRLSHTGSFSWSVSSGEIFWSEETFRIFAYDRATKPTWELVLQRVHPEDIALVQQLIDRASHDGKDWGLDYRLLMPDGSVKYVHVMAHAIRDESGTLEFVGAVMDITELKQAEEVLREQARLLDLTHDTVFIRDMNDVITYWNRGAEELYGWKREETVGKVTHQLMQTIFPAPLEEINAELLRTGRWEGELIHTKRDGTQVIVASRWSMQQDERGRPVAILETNNDITERKQAEEALRKAQTELAHVTRVMTMGELTASIAHEVNQPLAAIVTNGEACVRLLAGNPPDLEDAREAVAAMIRDGHRASDVIRRLRALVKKTPPQLEWLDVNALIREVLALTRSDVQRQGVALQTDLAADLPRVVGDRIQVQQVLLNLLMNGFDALRGVPEGAHELRVSSGTDASQAVRVAVRDTGIGLAATSLDRLFDAFYTTKPEGLRLGLAISRAIIEAHGGQLWAAPNAGPGATFQFTLPRPSARPV